MATINAINNNVIGDFPIAGSLIISSGNVELPATSDQNTGTIIINSYPKFHQYGTNCVFSGQSSGNFSLSSSNNTGLGYASGYSLSSGTGQNTLLGYFCARNVTTGHDLTALGNNIGAYDTAGGFTSASYSTLIGCRTLAADPSNYSSNIDLGYSPGEKGSSNNISLGGTDKNGSVREYTTVQTRICGISGKTSTSGAAVYCNSSNILGTTTSNRDSKQDIADMGDDSSVIYQLRARTFKFKADTDPKPKQFGMIAEEVEEVFPDMVLYDQDGKPWNLAYQFLAPMLVNEIQKLKLRLTNLQNIIAQRANNGN